MPSIMNCIYLIFSSLLLSCPFFSCPVLSCPLLSSLLPSLLFSFSTSSIFFFYISLFLLSSLLSYPLFSFPVPLSSLLLSFSAQISWYGSIREVSVYHSRVCSRWFYTEHVGPIRCILRIPNMVRELQMF